MLPGEALHADVDVVGERDDEAVAVAQRLVDTGAESGAQVAQRHDA